MFTSSADNDYQNKAKVLVVHDKERFKLDFLDLVSWSWSSISQVENIQLGALNEVFFMRQKFVMVEVKKKDEKELDKVDKWMLEGRKQQQIASEFPPAILSINLKMVTDKIQGTSEIEPKYCFKHSKEIQFF